MDELLIQVERLRNVMRDYVTNYEISKIPGEQARLKNLYTELRTELMESEIASLLPRSVKTHDTLAGFAQTVKVIGGYQARGEFIQGEFEPIIAKLNGEYVVPVDSFVADAIDDLNIDHIQFTWHRALARIRNEPDAAITSARTLIESVCKAILEKDGMTEADYKKDSLQVLFVKTWKVLDKKKRIDSIEGIRAKLNDLIAAFGILRNEYGDAHGRGSDYIPPTQIEAEFAVNLSGTLALLLIRRWSE